RYENKVNYIRLFKIISYKIKEKFYFFNSNNNKMTKLGYKRDCCCCLSLAEANLLIACLLYVSFIYNCLHNSTSVVTFLYFVYGTILILGVIFKSCIIFIMVILTQALWVTTFIYLLILEVILSFRNEKNTQVDKIRTTIPVKILVVTLILCILIIWINVHCLNIYISMIRTLKVGGSGWEHKNFEEIKHKQREIENAQQEIDNEKQAINNNKPIQEMLNNVS
ncbi:conserved membrane protein, unknown function, partial [Hepatocystis sp. ex Piliocolobus tephrosceles]